MNNSAYSCGQSYFANNFHSKQSRRGLITHERITAILWFETCKPNKCSTCSFHRQLCLERRKISCSFPVEQVFANSWEWSLDRILYKCFLRKHRTAEAALDNIPTTNCLQEYAINSFPEYYERMEPMKTVRRETKQVKLRKVCTIMASTWANIYKVECNKLCAKSGGRL